MRRSLGSATVLGVSTFFLCSLLLSLFPADAHSQKKRTRIQKATTWAYQLQGQKGKPINLRALAKTPYDILVIDYAKDGEPLTKLEVLRLKARKNNAPRIVLAYMSIGEAETYRFYWQKPWKKKPPSFLVKENPEWEENYKVRFWDPAWQRIIVGKTGKNKTCGYLDKIINAGFDGVYLDIIDAFEYFGPGGEQPIRPKAARDMAKFVISIAQHARKVRGRKDFLIVPQNGANILDEIDDTLQKRYLGAVDGIGAEDTFFFGEKKEDNELKIQSYTLGFLKAFRNAGKPVLAVEYLKDSNKAKIFSRFARKHKFLPYVGVRALDRLVAQPK